MALQERGFEEYRGFLAKKINLATARLVTVAVPGREDPFDDFLPPLEAELVVAEGIGKFEGITMVQIGILNEHKGPLGFVYRQELTRIGFRRGRDVAVDPTELREGRVLINLQTKGLWIPLDKLGIVKEEAITQ